MKILVLPGDGIGPEITQATLAVLDRANAKFKLGLEWEHDEMGLVTARPARRAYSTRHAPPPACCWARFRTTITRRANKAA